MPRHKKLSEVAVLSGGVAMLVLIAVVFGGFNLRGFGLGAAAVTASQSFGSSNLTLTAAASSVLPGDSTTITWDATNIVDSPNPTFCLTNGTACNAAIQSIPPVAETQSIQYTIGSTDYLLFYPGSQSASNAYSYKWSGSCWGDASGSCGTALQTLPVSYASASYFVGPDGNSYLAFAANNNSQSSNVIYKWDATDKCWGDGYICDDANISTTPVYFFQRPFLFNANAYGASTATISSSFYLFFAQNGGPDFSRLFKWMQKPTVQQTTSPRNFGLNGYTVIEKSWPLDPGRTITSVGVYLQTAGSTNTKVKIVKWNPAVATYDVVVDKLCPTTVAGWNDCTLSTPYTVPTNGVYYAAAYNGSSPNGANAAYGGSARAYRLGDIVGSGQGSFGEQGGTGEAIRVTYQSGGNYFCFGTGGICGISYQNFAAPQGGGYYAAGGGELFSIGASTYLLTGDYSNAAPHLFKWMTSTVVPGWYTTPPNSGYANNTVVDRNYPLVPGSTVSRIGFYSSGAQTTAKIKIFRRNGFGSYDVVYDQSVSHTGGGWIDFNLNTPFVVPSTGEYYAGTYTSNNAGYSASGGTRSWTGGDQTGNINNYSEDQSSSGVVTRTTYSSPVGCFGDGTICGNALQTFPNTTPLGQSLTNGTGGWKIFTQGSDTYAALATNGNNSHPVFKWNAASNCFGSMGGACGVPYEEVTGTSGSGSNFGDGWSLFTYAGNLYGILQQYGGNANIYRWMTVSMQQGGTPNNTALVGQTSLHRQLQLVNGATLTKIGVYYSGASASMKVKILKRNSAGNYDIVVDQAFTHPGTGWYDVTLNTPYTVPASGDYFPGVYTAVNIGTFSVPTGYMGSYTARAYKGTDALGAAQSFTEDQGNNAPALRATYNSSAVKCFGDGVSLCNTAYVSTPVSYAGGFNFFILDNTPYMVVSSLIQSIGVSGVFKFASIPCFGSMVKCDTSTSPASLQSFTDNQATNDWETFTTTDGTYAVESNSLSGASSALFKWMSGSQCLGNGTTCGSSLQSFALNFSYFRTITASDGTVYGVGGGLPSISGGTQMTSVYAYKWMSGSQCFGNGTTCGTALQTFPTAARIVKLINVTSGGTTSTYLMLAVFNTSPTNMYKLMPASGCFGNGTTCGSVYQAVSGDAVDWNTTTIGSNTYLLDINHKARSLIYKWTPSGSGCPAGGGWGNGTACDTGVGNSNCTNGIPSGANYFQLIGGYGGSTCDTHHTTGIFFTQGGNTYLSIGTDGGTNEFWGISVWMPNANGGLGCFGDGNATCNATYSIDIRDNNMGKQSVFTSNNATYLTSPRTNTSINIYKWTTGTGCPSSGGWGNGASCGTSNYFQQISSSGNNDLAPLSSGYIYGLMASNNPALYEFIDNPSPDLGCTVSWSDTNGNSGLLATGDSNPTGVSTGPLFASTTYTLTCPGAGSVAVTVGVNTVPSNLQISANPATLNIGSTTTVGWSTAGVFTNSCGVTQTDPNNITSSFSNIAAGDTRTIDFTPSLGGTYTYKLSCVAPYGAGNNGTIINSLSSTVGKFGQALSFSNTNSNTTILDNYVDIANTPALQNLQNGNYTISAWFKPLNDPPGTLGGTVAYNDANNDVRYALVSKTGWHIGLSYSHGGAFLMEHWLTGDVYKSAGWKTSHPAGQWYNVVGVVNKDAGTIKLYVNGVDDDWVGDPNSSFTPGTAARDYGTIDWKIGIAGPGFGNYRWAANGVIDDVRFYNRALSADEAATLAAGGQVTTGLVAYYSMDTSGTSGTTVYDQAGGVVTNSASLNVTAPTPPTLSGCTSSSSTPSGCSLYVSPLRVRTGDSAQVSWNVSGLAPGLTCSINSTPSIGGLPITWNGSGSSWSGGPTTIGPISKQTTVTLTCTVSSTGNSSTVQKVIGLTPSFQEI